MGKGQTFTLRRSKFRESTIGDKKNIFLASTANLQKAVYIDLSRWKFEFSNVTKQVKQNK